MKLHWKILIGIALGLVYTLFIGSVSDTFLDLNTNKEYDISEPFVDTNNNGSFDSNYIDFTKNWVAPSLTRSTPPLGPLQHSARTRAGRARFCRQCS